MSAPFPPPAGRPRWLEGAGGVSLYAVEWDGAPGAVPVLLVHGLASNCRTWEAVAGLLADAGHPVVALDQRGHGLSDQPDHGYDFATLCDDLVAVLDGLGWLRAVVVGQSTGGNIAVELARRAPERLAGVAGIDGGVLELQDRFPEWEHCATALAPPPLAGTPVATVREWIRASHPDWDDWGIEATLANLEVLADSTVRARLSRDHHMRILRALWEHRPSTFLGELTVPVLLLLADADDDHAADRRAAGERAARLLRHGSVHWESADHDIHVHRPARVAKLLLASLDG